MRSPSSSTFPPERSGGGSIHKGDPFRDLEEVFAGRLILERLPPYAPELNPVEFVWNWLKCSRLNNFAPRDAAQLNERTVAELAAILSAIRRCCEALSTRRRFHFDGHYFPDKL